MSDKDRETLLEALRDFVEARVAEGFESPDDIADGALDYFEDESLADEAEACVDRAMAAHMAAQEGWTEPTDCDKLDAAFEALNADGIVARQNFTCCQTCGHAEIGLEVDEAVTKLPGGGYTFYHFQDTERAVEDGNLFLAFGDWQGAPVATALVAQKVVEALEAAGLSVEWGGSTTSRIMVTGLEWRKRR